MNEVSCDGENNKDMKKENREGWIIVLEKDNYEEGTVVFEKENSEGGTTDVVEKY